MDKLGLLRRAAKAADHTDPVEPDTLPVEPECIKVMRDDSTRTYNDALILDYIDSLQSALKVAQRERDKLKPYWLAIDHRMVVLHLGTADSFDADTCMNKILEWETEIALDPQVSRPAQELKDTHLQRAEKAETDLDEFKRDAEQKKSEALAVIRKLLEALTHPNPPTSGQWEAIRVEARKQIAAIDSEKEGK